MRVLYHDDFDGVASAALLGAWQRFVEPKEPLAFTSVDYGHTDLAWDSDRPKGVLPAERLAIVDFMFHPAAEIYVDHHATAFRSAAALDQFVERRTRYAATVPYYWNSTAPSCAQALAEILPPYFTRPFAELIVEATMIDQAAYPDVQAVLTLSTDAIALSQAIPLMSEGQKGELIRRLMTGSLTEAAKFAAEPIAEARRRSMDGMALNEAASTLLGCAVVTDLVTNDAPWVRFSAYGLYPQAKYALTIYRTGQLVRVALGKNPWLDFEPTHLGDLCKTVGGGGHAYAAGAQFEGDDAYGSAWRFIRRVMDAVNA